MATQWVNLAKKNEVLETGETQDELGPTVDVKLTMTKKARSAVRYTLEPDGGNARYTTAELGRNPAFRADAGAGVGTTDANGEITIRVRLPPAGGDKFTLKAKRVGVLRTTKEAKSSPAIETARRLFYQSVPMVGVQPPDLQPLKDHFWNLAKIQLVEREPSHTLTAKETWEIATSGADGAIYDEMRARRAAMLPYAPGDLVVFWVNHLASPRYPRIKQTQATPAGATGTIPVTVASEEYLWHGPGIDTGTLWLSDLQGTFTPVNGTAALALQLATTMAQLDGTPVAPGAGYRQVRVDVPAAELVRVGGTTEGTLALDVRLQTMASPAAGESSGNSIILATKVGWKTKPDAELLYVLVHELGHRLGMVCTGGKPGVPGGMSDVDAPPTYYTAQGHTGPHCSLGATYDSTQTDARRRWSGNPGCVMFGSNAVLNGTAVVRPPTTFCAACAERVRRLPL